MEPRVGSEPGPAPFLERSQVPRWPRACRGQAGTWARGLTQCLLPGVRDIPFLPRPSAVSGPCPRDTLDSSGFDKEPNCGFWKMLLGGTPRFSLRQPLFILPSPGTFTLSLQPRGPRSQCERQPLSCPSADVISRSHSLVQPTSLEPQGPCRLCWPRASPALSCPSGRGSRMDNCHSHPLCVFVSWGCRDTVTQTGRFQTADVILSQFWRRRQGRSLPGALEGESGPYLAPGSWSLQAASPISASVLHSVSVSLFLSV